MNWVVLCQISIVLIYSKETQTQGSGQTPSVNSEPLTKSELADGAPARGGRLTHDTV